MTQLDPARFPSDALKMQILKILCDAGSAQAKDVARALEVPMAPLSELAELVSDEYVWKSQEKREKNAGSVFWYGPTSKGINALRAFQKGQAPK